MKRNRIILLLALVGAFCLISQPSAAQTYTHNHEEPIMQQFLTMETGAGALTPRYYYNAFHKSYQRTANVENKGVFRLHMKGRVADEVEYADSIDSVTCRRAKVEAQNIVDRSPMTDMAWVAEKSKIENKLSIFQNNINHIMPYGGTAEDYGTWKNIYNCIQTAIRITRESYQDLGRRKKEYMAIYKDIVKRNYQLTRQLLAWNSVKSAREMQKNSKAPQRLTSNSTAAYDALNRWKVAMAVDGFSAGSKRSARRQ